MTIASELLEGVYTGASKGSIIRFIEGDTRSLDYSSHRLQKLAHLESASKHSFSNLRVRNFQTVMVMNTR